MFLSLFGKECKFWSKSIMYYVYIAIIVLFYITQVGTLEPIMKPQAGEKSYGFTTSKDETVIMNSTIKNLIQEYQNGSFATYPIGFYKQVILNEQQSQKIESYISKLTGLGTSEWKDKVESYNQGRTVELQKDGSYLQEETVEWSIFISENISYKEFLSTMDKVEDIIGKGSDYSRQKIAQSGQVEMTYEQAMEEYEAVLTKDKVVGAYARLFCDYMGILLAILPVFFGVTRVLKDKRSQASQVIYAKKVSSIMVVTSRYVGMVVMLFLPVLLVAGLSMGQAGYIAKAASVVPNYGTYLIYCVGWLLPEIMVAVGVGYLFTELTEHVIAILIQAVWWFVSIFMGMTSIVGLVGWNLIPRFNTVGKREVFDGVVSQLVRNRLVYSLVGIALFGLTIVIYEVKRKGGYSIRGKVSKNVEYSAEK